jgi:hypothetical protein
MVRVIPEIVREKTAEILERPQIEAWAACAAIWSRIYVLSGPGWEDHQGFHELVRSSYSLAIRRAVGPSSFVPNESLIRDLEGFDVEDDGSATWNYMIDVMEMISPVIGGQDIEICLKTAIRVYLETSFNVRVGDFAIERGRPISYADARTRIVDDPVWIKSVSFLNSLL